MTPLCIERGTIEYHLFGTEGIMSVLYILSLILILILVVHAVIDLHDSVVVLKSYAPEAEISKFAQLAYTAVHFFKK